MSDLDALADRYRRDPESVYHTWFHQDGNRLKAFRSIRRGVEEVVSAVRAGTFGNDYKVKWTPICKTKKQLPRTPFFPA